MVVADVRTSRIIGAAIEVHRALGPGLLESAYAACLAVEFAERGIPAVGQLALPVQYKGIAVAARYRLDFVAFSEVVVEVKSVEQLLPVHTAQLLTYLKLGRYRTGLLLNFNVPALRDGIVRVVA
ncbi:MAG: GxxExxY protein [Gemmatimonadetes bacterium]|nr:GxxExxY protein [Gemmatimonadota bacterium]